MSPKGTTMKHVMRSAMAALLVLLAANLVTVAHAAKPWEKIKVPPLNEFQMPAYERVQLKNGMVLYLAEDHFLPMIELSATIRGGSVYEQADKVGLAEMTGSVLRTGGAGTRTGDDIDQLAEARGLNVETWIGETNGGAYLSVLKEDTDLGLGLLADILMRPQFAEDKIDLAKEEQKAGIARRNDAPMSIAMREGMKVLFGPEHPLARHPEYDTIAAVTRADMVAFHEMFFHPDRAYLVVVGDFQTKDLIARIEKAFAGWAPASRPMPPEIAIDALPRTVNAVSKDDLTQSTLLLGHKGIRNDDPNYAGIVVANEILGGGFSSRLFNEVRSKRGWAYSVGSQAGTGWQYPGMFLAFTMTKNSTVQQAAEVILAEIDRMVKEPVSEAELQKARDQILNSEVFSYDTKRKVLDRLVLFEMNGYPQDFLETYQTAVRELTPAKVQAAAAAVWRPDQLSILAVGNKAEWDGDLTRFGPVNDIDITIPEPKMQIVIPAATPESLAKGHDLMVALREKSGGKKLTGLKSYREVSVMTIAVTQMGPMDITLDKTVVFPDKMALLQKLPFGEATQVVTPEAGWAKSPMGNKDMSGEELTEARQEMKNEMVFILRDLGAYDCQALEPTEVEGVACQPVHVKPKGSEDFQIYFLNAATGQVHMVQSQGNNPMTGSPVTQKIYSTETGELGGFPMSTAQRWTFDDEDFCIVTVKEFQADPTVDPGLFKKP
jgi:zinc protease